MVRTEKLRRWERKNGRSVETRRKGRKEEGKDKE